MLRVRLFGAAVVLTICACFPTIAGAQQPATLVKLGELRVGNKTPYPVRVVVTKGDGSLEGAFWDFAPGEGGSEGIRLTLPDKPDKPMLLAEGDVLTIFALDGSRRYWGPNILGKTVAPFWDGKRKIWSTVLRP
ncbi:MAG: hypothetical protein H7Y37_12325 [Anaerolineae bacterium]|nr:hypothetical protein [Gloeobacterales cyanobacterium ES-bin-313]